MASSGTKDSITTFYNLGLVLSNILGIYLDNASSTVHRGYLIKYYDIATRFIAIADHGDPDSFINCASCQNRTSRKQRTLTINEPITDSTPV